MVRQPYFDRKLGVKKGAWEEEEDNILRAYVHQNCHPNWRLLPSRAGLARCGKSCRLRWVNYLKPGVRRGNFSNQEKDLIIKLHSLLGPKWSDIAKVLPGRTDNDIKNYWNAHIQKRDKTSRVSDQQQQSSSDDQLCSPCITTHNDPQEETSEITNAVSPIANANSVEQAQQNIWAGSSYSQVLINLPPFPAEELFHFEEDTIDLVLWSYV